MENKAQAAGPHISIKAEPIFHAGSFPVTNSLLLSTLTLIIFTILAYAYYRQSQQVKKGMLFYSVTALTKGVYDMFESSMGESITIFFPLIGSFFLYILINNWFGLLPGVGSVLYHHDPLLRATTADLNTTLALALVTMTCIQVFGIKYAGFSSYIKKFINFGNPMNFFVGILELVSEFSRILSFAFRLFGNIFAGEVLLSVVSFLVPWGISFPFLLLETFVGLIQALVFSMLSAVLLRLAISKHH